MSPNVGTPKSIREAIANGKAEARRKLFDPEDKHIEEAIVDFIRNKISAFTLQGTPETVETAFKICDALGARRRDVA